MQASSIRKHTKIKVSEQNGFAGSYTIRTHKEGEIKYTCDYDEHGKPIIGTVKVDIESFKQALGRPLYEHPRVENLVVSGSGGYGRNLVIRALGNDPTYGLAITSGKIGTGTTAPTNADTDIQTVALSGITVQLAEVSDNVIVVSFFIPSASLSNGTYTEFTVHVGGSSRLFARSLITPSFAKGSNQDTTIEYTFTLY